MPPLLLLPLGKPAVVAPPEQQNLTTVCAAVPRVQASAEAIAAHGAFTLALSGGSLIKALAGLVGRADVDFSKW